MMRALLPAALVLCASSHRQNPPFNRVPLQISIVDMWKDYTPPPFKQMPDTYAFLVGQLGHNSVSVWWL